MHTDTTGPNYSLVNFQNLLRFRGVARKPNETSGESASSSSGDDESPYSRPNFENSAHSIRTWITDNPDLFYTSLSKNGIPDSIVNSSTLDRNYTYVSANGSAGDRRYSNNSERVIAGHSSLLLDASEQNNTAYRVWEQHDELTKKEIASSDDDCAVVDEDSMMDEDVVSNGGIYDPYRPELSTLNTLSSTQLLILPPAAKYRDSLNLKFKKGHILEKLDHLRKYKNNLTGVLCSKTCADLMFIGCLSEIAIFEFDPMTNCPNKSASLKFETRPLTTSMHDRVVSTYPYFPHTLNFLKTQNDWLQGSVVGVCSDDGSVHIWHGDTFGEHIEKNRHKPSNSLYGLKIAPDITCKLNSSAWGLDFGKARDPAGNTHFIFAASANSKTATLCYVAGTGIHSQETHETLHNIPEVTIIDYTISEKSHVVHLSCTTIYGEILIFKFEFVVASTLVDFEAPEITRRTCLQSPCWTSRPVDRKYFKEVQSTRAMVGDPSIEENSEAAKILLESRIVSLDTDPIHSSDFGGAASWQYFDTPVVDLASPEEAQQSINSHSKLQSFQEENRRLHQTYWESCSGQAGETTLRDKLLLASTEDRLGLFRADTLFCLGATKRVFTLDIPKNEETKWCDRISIAEVIPELSCYIAVTQSGLVSIFRLCQHRGLHGMRQEHIFPNALSVTMGESSYRTLVGLSVRDMSASPEWPRFDIHLLYSDGLALSYELHPNQDEFPEI